MRELRALLEVLRAPLAVRPSSFLEDTQQRAFAGIFTSKLIPNSEESADARYRRLSGAVKLAWASTFFENALVSRRVVRACRRRREDGGDHSGDHRRASRRAFLPDPVRARAFLQPLPGARQQARGRGGDGGPGSGQDHHRRRPRVELLPSSARPRRRPSRARANSSSSPRTVSGRSTSATHRRPTRCARTPVLCGAAWAMRRPTAR